MRVPPLERVRSEVAVRETTSPTPRPGQAHAHHAGCHHKTCPEHHGSEDQHEEPHIDDAHRALATRMA